MSKLCLHHQRQIISAIRFLQAEVKALAPFKASPPVTAAQRSRYSPAASPLPPTRPSSQPSKSYRSPDLRATAKPRANPSVFPAAPSSTHTATTSTVEARNGSHGDHGPLKLKIMKTGSVAAGNKLSCVLATSLLRQPGDDKPGGTSSAETHCAGLHASFRKQSESSLTRSPRQVVGHSEDKTAKPFSFHVTVPSNSPRTARKSIRPSAERQSNDFNDRIILDPDLGHCDIVYINKPITECFKKRHRGMKPRRNARKSTRGLMYAEEIWELKTIRTLAGRGNCPNPLLEFNSSVTPKQNLSKPEGVPPVDMPCAGECREAMDQQMATQEPTESELSETGQAKDTAASDADVLVETSQTDQSQTLEEMVRPSPAITEELQNTEQRVEQDQSAESSESKDVTPQVSIEENEMSQNTEQDCPAQHVLPEMAVESVKDTSEEQSNEQGSTEDIVAPRENPGSTDNVLQEKEPSEENEKDPMSNEPTHEQTEIVTEERSIETDGGRTSIQPAEETATEQEREAEENTGMTTVTGTYEKENEVSSKSMEELAKELPPWRRRKNSISCESKCGEKAEVIVGFVSGKPISASDRSLRRRSGQTVPPEMPKQSKRGQKVQNKTDSNSNTKSSDSEKPSSVELESEEARTDSNRSVPPVTEQSSDKPSPRTKKSKADRKKAVGQRTSSRQLRSSGQTLVESPSLLPLPVTTVSEPVTTVSEPVTTVSEPVATPQSSTTESEESLTTVAPAPDPAPIPALELKSPQTTAMPIPSETSTESKVDEEKSESDERPQSKEEVQSKPKLGSAKDSPGESKAEEENSGQRSAEMTVKSELHSQAMSLRSKRTLQNEADSGKSSRQPKPNVEAQAEGSSSVDSSGPVAKKPARMPLRSEGSKADPSPAAGEKRPSLRSQRQSAAGNRQSELASPIRMTRTLVRPNANGQSTSTGAVCSSRSEPPRPPSVKFLEALNGAHNQQLISNLNLKFDKMHKGWMQLDREGHPTPKHKNKSDRQAAIWKSKRRARKPKMTESSKCSPVQMLFMRGFDFNSICRWFLETTETKSLVIVKKVNTRLPSETQLCFHSSCASGSSQGVYPSLQAERLKKHLKKFAIASPVKSTPKTQKLIAKALEQEWLGVVKGKEKKEAASACVKKVDLSTKREAQKPKSGKTQNPASARILRKYSNIREKAANARLKDEAKAKTKEKANVKAHLKSLTKVASKPNLKSLKPTEHVKKTKAIAEKSDKKKAVVEKSNEQKSIKLPKDKAVKAVKVPGKSVEVRKECPKRTSQRLVSTAAPEPNVITAPKHKTDKKVEEKKPVETSRSTKTKAVKVQGKETEGKRPVNPETNTDRGSSSPDQVQTRSQSKVDASVSAAPKRGTRKSVRGNKAPAERRALTRSGALKRPAKRSQTAVLPRSASRKAQELLETPAKRTRTK